MSSEGTITADIIKNAMFKAADDIEGRYSKMPKTIGDYWTLIKNKAIQAFTPVIEKISELINTPKFQGFFDSLCVGIQLAAEAVNLLIDGFSWLCQIIEPLAPAIWVIVGALVAYKTVTMLMTVAQWALNAAMTACPLTWIIIAIVAIIAILAVLWENCEGFRNFVAKTIAHGAKTLGWFYNNIIVPVANGVIDALNLVNEAQRNFWKWTINRICRYGN